MFNNNNSFCHFLVFIFLLLRFLPLSFLRPHHYLSAFHPPQYFTSQRLVHEGLCSQACHLKEQESQSHNEYTKCQFTEGIPVKLANMLQAFNPMYHRLYLYWRWCLVSLLVPTQASPILHCRWQDPSLHTSVTV